MPDGGETRPLQDAQVRRLSAARARLARHREHVLEAVATAVLAAATLGTAWSGYQATRWSGVQSADYVTASGLRVDSTKAATRSGQDLLFDSQVFSQWLNAKASGDALLAELYRRRFRPEFVPAFEAWLATDPFDHASGPPGPLYMKEYVSAEAVRAGELERQAQAMFAAGSQANETGDRYVLGTVFFASALFLGGIAGRFRWATARVVVLVIAASVLAVGAASVLSLPVE